MIAKVKNPSIYIDILTIFPDFFSSPLKTSLLEKALSKNLINVKIHNIRRFGEGSAKQVDDKPFGGGPGMVFKPNVLTSCLQFVKSERSLKVKPFVIFLDPTGAKLTQSKVKSLSRKKWLILISGHYEGIDQRFKENYVDEEISIGDYILSGGEVASLVLIDSVSRLIPGFVSKTESVTQESFSIGEYKKKKVPLLDYPVYTRPAVFEGKNVPEVLLSGDHQKINIWRRDKSIEVTKKKRPDLLKG